MATEDEILASLGLTQAQITHITKTNGARLLILDCSAHLDWDWLLPFPVLAAGGSGQGASHYFSNKAPANTIFHTAAGLLAGAGYHYSICEMAYLRAFASSLPSEFADLASTTATNRNLRIAGGGMTSPDSLLTHGEAFIRAYLLGHVWLAANLPSAPPPVSAWLPDDFGHDTNLPIVVQAMGFRAVGFARVPGNYSSPPTPINGGDNMVQTLKTMRQSDFVWNTWDGSSIVAHFMVDRYSQGSELTSLDDITAPETGYLATNAQSAPTPYIYVPVIGDFLPPNTAITGILQHHQAGVPWDKTRVYLAAGAFEDYAQLVMFHQGDLSSMDNFNPNPYYTGCYGTRPALKILHQRATRNLLAAELFSIMAAHAEPAGSTASLGTGKSVADLFAEAWNLLVPSTHHDYITGTAIPDVYHREQMLLLHQANARAQWLLRDAMQTIAASVNPSNGDDPGVVVFNPLGFARSEVVELSANAMRNLNVQLVGDGFQNNADGSFLFIGSAPSMGYQTNFLGGSSAAPAHPATVASSSSSVVLSNGLVQATLAPDANGIWGLTSVVDVQGSNAELIAAGAVANDLLFYFDGGDEYQFGMEKQQWTLTDVTSNLCAPSIKVLECGPLRVCVATVVTYKDEHVTIDFVREYILHANEPMLRMRTSGAAPMLQQIGCSVVVAFPLNTGTPGINYIQRGTPYHWTDVEPSAIYWNDQTFLATHNFVLPFPEKGGPSPLCAIYHSDVPGWGISYQWDTTSKQFEVNNGVLYGCLFRNGNANYFGLSDTYSLYGTDPGTHVREYALRVPTGLGGVTSAAPLLEALALRSPLTGLFLEPVQSTLSDTISLISSTTSTSGSGALVTVAKWGTVNPSELVVRVYTSGNMATDVTLTVDSILNTSADDLNVAAITALEQPLQDGPSVQTTPMTISFTASTALTTLAIMPR